jgi:hypothetical protein
VEWLKQIRTAITSVWGWVVQAIDYLLFYLREANPKYVVAVYVLFNAAIAVWAYIRTKEWNDFWTVSGYWITLTGLLVAIVELYRARTVAGQIRDALSQEVRRQRGYRYRFCLERAKSVLSDARMHVHSRRWTVAVVRLNDLISYLSYVQSISPAVDDRWTRFANSVQRWVVEFNEGQNGRMLQYNGLVWQELVGDILRHLDNELAPFQFGEEVDDDTERRSGD